MMMSSNAESSVCGSSASSTGGGEFEIARVLASLRRNDDAMAAAMEEEMRGSSVGCCIGRGESVGLGGQSGNSNGWGSKGKRWMRSGSSKRVKETTSMHCSPPLSPLSPSPFDLNVDQPCVFQEECQNVDFKAEETYQSAGRGCVWDSSRNGGRSRHNLSEADKETRRIRRILANRESARQTIRRRQAFHEELTRKAAELASENDNLKRSKEKAVEEYQSLQSNNQNLKGQLSKTLGFKLGENKGEAQPSCPETNNLHSASWAQFMYKKLSAGPFLFPACLPPPDMNESNLQQFCDPRMFAEQDNALSINGQNMPWCLVPCPIFLPLPDIKNCSSLHLKDRDEGTSADFKNVLSPSSVISCLRNCPIVKPEDKKSRDAPPTQDDCRNGFHQNLFGFSLEGGGQQIVPQFSCCLRNGLALDREDCVTPHTLLNADVSSARGMETENAMPEKRKERILRKRECSVAGAEARRKRKELMKLKSRLHCHLLGQENG